MTASAAISNLFADRALQARPADNSSSGKSTQDTNTISANDFLTLLVTEMKNQDPTNSTDPNQYVNQLVSVNSLQQLIQINETLSGALSAGPSPTSGNTAPPAAGDLSANRAAAMPPVSFGNLGVPAANPAAQRVAQALAPHPRA